MRVRVIRVIEIVGTIEWVRATLNKSIGTSGSIFISSFGTITELVRIEEQIPEVLNNDNQGV